MPKSRWLLTFAALAGTLLAQTSSKPEAEKTATVEGDVTNSLTGEVVPRAHVILRASSGQRYGATTDAEGKYSISGLPSGNYFAMVERAGFVRAMGYSARRDVVSVAGNDRKQLKLKITPMGEISGRILDSQGEPVEGIPVTADGNTPAYGRSDDKGQYRLGGLEPGKYRVKATPYTMPSPPELRSDGTVEVHYATTWYPGAPEEKSAGRVVVRAGAETPGVDVRLAPSPVVRLSGKVTDVPAGATMIRVSATSLTGGRPGFGMVKADGTFEVWRLDPGRYRVTAEFRQSGGGSLQSTIAEVDVGSMNVENVELRMVAPVDVQGQFAFDDDRVKQLLGGTTDKNQQPPRRWSRQLQLQEVGAYRFQSTPIAPDGTFRLENFTVGKFRLSMPGAPVYIKSIRVGQTSTEGNILDASGGIPAGSLTLVLSSAMVDLSGIVRDEKGLAPDKQIALVPEATGPGQGVQVNRSTDGGRYIYKGLTPGKYKLLVFDEGDMSLIMQGKGLELYERTTETIELKPGDVVERDLKCPAPEN